MTIRPRSESEKLQLDVERWQLLEQLIDGLEGPMTFLGIVWAALLVWQLAGHPSRLIADLSGFIWGLFVLDFLGELLVAPHKLRYLERHWLVGLSLVLPALRVLRFVRLVRIAHAAGTEGATLVRLLGSVNRSMQALGATMQRRGFRYVVALSIVVTILGAAGAFTFENRAPGGLTTFGDALWWSAMMMTTMGSDYWPRTAAGRILALLLALYAFAIFGYVTATIATFFVDRDAEDNTAALAGQKAIDALREEMTNVRAEVRALRDELKRG